MVSIKRDHLVEVACDLFYRNGFHATGIDSILAEAEDDALQPFQVEG